MNTINHFIASYNINLTHENSSLVFRSFVVVGELNLTCFSCSLRWRRYLQLFAAIVITEATVLTT